MLSTLVKISNVTNLSDARYCAGMGVEWIGFTIDEENANYVSPKKFNEIKSWLAGVNVLIETSQPVETITAALEEYEVDGIQVTKQVQASAVKGITGKATFVTLDTALIAPADLEKIIAENVADYYVLESESDQTLTDEWKQAIAAVAPQAALLLGVGLDETEDLKGLLEELGVAGIALKGSEEIRPGFKDFGALMDILELLEEE